MLFSGRDRTGLASGYGVHRSGRVAGLLKLTQRLAAHRGVDVQVRLADDRGQLLEEEEDDAVVEEASPVTPEDQVALQIGEVVLPHEARLVGAEPRAEGRIDETVEELAHPVALDAPLEREGIGALEGLEPAGLVRDPRAVALDLPGLRRGVVVVEDQRGDARHRRQVVGLVALGHLRRQGPAHDQPHHDLGALEPAHRRELGERHPGQTHRILLDELEEFSVPARVVEAGALAMHLMREPAGGDDRDPEVRGIALDRPAQRLAQPVAAARAGLGAWTTPTCSGTMGNGQPPSWRQSKDRGEKQPWSSGRSWKKDMSNSSATSDCPTCAARPGWPAMAGRSRGPPPSSATSNRSPMPSANAEWWSKKNEVTWSL